MNLFYRPEWTCGKYNSEAQTAILYNLIEGSSHFFEGISATVIGQIISYGRNILIPITELSNMLNIELESIIEFCEELIQLGLITKHVYSADEILSYRHSIAKKNQCSYNQTKNMPNGVEIMELGLLGAEEDYAQSIGGWSNVVFEMTYRCSERCIHCYNMGSTHYETDIDRRGDREELSLYEYKQTIDQLLEIGLFKVCITGGDTFSNSKIWDVLEYLYEMEVAVEIYTNGISITNQIDRLVSLYPRIVGMTVYSAIEDVHDRITRVHGSLQKTLYSMKQLAELAVPLQLKCCVFNVNFESYKSVYTLAKELCALPQIEINIKNTLDGNKYASKCLRLTDEQYEELFRDPNIYPFITSESLDNLIPRDFKKNACNTGISSCTLTPEGDIIPCPAFHLKFGNIRQSSILEILNGKELRKWKEITLNDYTECGTHEFCDFCSICPGENYSDTSNPLKPSENKCFMAKKRWAYAKKIHDKTGKSDAL